MRVKHCPEKGFVSVLMYSARHRKASKPCRQALWKPLCASLEGALVSDLERWTLRLGTVDTQAWNSGHSGLRQSDKVILKSKGTSQASQGLPRWR